MVFMGKQVAVKNQAPDLFRLFGIDDILLLEDGEDFPVRGWDGEPPGQDNLVSQIDGPVQQGKEDHGYRVECPFVAEVSDAGDIQFQKIPLVRSISEIIVAIRSISKSGFMGRELFFSVFFWHSDR
jgi:hypothetical protein